MIVTGPPSLTALIRYEPDLPALRAQLLQRFPQGSAIKVEAVYPRPFWREHGLAGQVTSDTGPIKLTFDNSPPDGSPGVLLGFVEGHDARVFGTLVAAERRRQALACFVRYFGPQAAHPTSYIEMNWSAEPWTRGCYGGYAPPGVLTDYGPCDARARRPNPLGRSRDLGLLERLHGRRRALRRARRPRGACRDLSRLTRIERAGDGKNWPHAPSDRTRGVDRPRRFAQPDDDRARAVPRQRRPGPDERHRVHARRVRGLSRRRRRDRARPGSAAPVARPQAGRETRDTSSRSSSAWRCCSRRHCCGAIGIVSPSAACPSPRARHARARSSVPRSPPSNSRRHFPTSP